MKKSDAIKLLGNTPGEAANAIGITYQAFAQWPDVLTRRLVDRVQAALARKYLPAEALGNISSNGDISTISGDSMPEIKERA